MMDLPYPSILEGDNENQIQIIYRYLIQLHDALEFEISNISSENLSDSLTLHLETIQALIKATSETADNAQIIAQQRGVTIEEVVSSSLFKAALNALELSVKAYADELKREVDTSLLGYYTKAEVDTLLENVYKYIDEKIV